MDSDSIIPLEGFDPVVGMWMWAMQDTRERTLESFKGLNDKAVNWVGSGETNSIGSLLYHIAAIEMSWLYEDILEGMNFPQEINALMKYDVRDEEGLLTSVIVESLDTHLNRLKVCRKYFLSAFEKMSAEEFRRLRKLEEYKVTPEWVVHHLMQHEAEHRGQVGEIRKLAERALG